MATFRGQDGLVALGGHLIGAVAVNGAVAAAATTVNLDTGGVGTLTGVSGPGDRFTIAGQTYTVTGPFRVAAGNALTGVTFTPGAVGGFADNAPVIYQLNALAEVRQWTLTPQMQALDTTVCRQGHRTYRPGLHGWTGQAQALFDAADPQQRALLDRIASGTPATTTAAVLFGLLEGQPHDFYGSAVLTNFQVESPLEELVTVRFDWQGSDLVRVQWS
jgi:hypothetical protein